MPSPFEFEPNGRPADRPTDQPTVRFQLFQTSEDLRGRLYDGLDIDIKNDTGNLIETYYLEALADDWDVLSAECVQIIKQLPKAFGT